MSKCSLKLLYWFTLSLTTYKTSYVIPHLPTLFINVKNKSLLIWHTSGFSLLFEFACCVGKVQRFLICREFTAFLWWGVCTLEFHKLFSIHTIRHYNKDSIPWSAIRMCLYILVMIFKMTPELSIYLCYHICHHSHHEFSVTCRFRFSKVFELLQKIIKAIFMVFFF